MNDTIKIRMLVAVDHNGHYHAIGWAGATDCDLHAELDAIEEYDGMRRYWINASVPRPQPVEPSEIDTTDVEAA